MGEVDAKAWLARAYFDAGLGVPRVAILEKRIRARRPALCQCGTGRQRQYQAGSQDAPALHGPPHGFGLSGLITPVKRECGPERSFVGIDPCRAWLGRAGESCLICMALRIEWHRIRSDVLF
ncbi:MAG TPA: hypothetical protein VHI72_19345, partial [Hyphomicrobiaceae bacterium]|nr:hypothetical protein [Hyphomicrobiaceae bacterium]